MQYLDVSDKTHYQQLGILIINHINQIYRYTILRQAHIATIFPSVLHCYQFFFPFLQLFIITVLQSARAISQAEALVTLVTDFRQKSGLSNLQ